MATNLRAKISSSDSLLIHDLNTTATTKFQEQNKGVEVVGSVREVAEKAVSCVLSSCVILLPR